MSNPVIIKDYFNKLDDLLTTLMIKDKPSRIWNADETGLSLSLIHISCARKYGIFLYRSQGSRIINFKLSYHNSMLKMPNGQFYSDNCKTNTA